MKSGFYSLCYHYVRKNCDDPLPRLLGTKISDFNEHIAMFKKEYNIVSLNDVSSFYYEKSNFRDIKNGLLITFDDGLSDQYEAAKILAENNISATFFIPTCIIKDTLPANPIIIHYAIAIHGMKKFLVELKELIKEKHFVNETYFDKVFLTNDIHKSIDMIKNIFYYELELSQSRDFLIDVFKKMIQKEKFTVHDMHFSKDQIRKLLDMGHFIGTHSYSHISLGRRGITNADIEKELIYPKNDLECAFNTNVTSMSYPFGESRDCFNAQELFKKTNTYQLAFTVEHKFNTKNTSPLEIGRYMVNSKDSANKLNKIIELHRK